MYYSGRKAFSNSRKRLYLQGVLKINSNYGICSF
nr:MAG TPA: hypothetical protein [Caudoviricetes sp.]